MFPDKSKPLVNLMKVREHQQPNCEQIPFSINIPSLDWWL